MTEIDDVTIEIDGKRYRRMQVGEVLSTGCRAYAPVDRPPLIVETEHWRTLRDDEDVRGGDRVKTARGVYFSYMRDGDTAASLVARVVNVFGDDSHGVVQRRCGPLGEDL